MMHCPQVETLRQWLEESLSPEEQSSLSTHVANCESCQSALEDLTEFSVSPGPKEDQFSLRQEFYRYLQEDLWESGPLQTTDHPGSQSIEDPLATGPILDSTTQPIPQTIAHYKIVSELGRGGMGVVYLARQKGLNRLVALKMVRQAEHADRSEVQRFQREAESIARLSHPNIVQIHEIGESQGLPFFSLEYISGGSLADRLKKHVLTEQESANLIEVLAQAVHFAHQQNIIHRDIKPGNVLMGEHKTPKLTDFGLARRIDEAGVTGSGAIMGTPSYMAPEQAAGKIHHPGPALDIYALGAVLYECLTGQPPFRARTAVDTIWQVLRQEPVAPSHLQPKLSRDLETICLKCLEKNPANRYESAEALADDLRRFQRREPIHARPISRLGRTWRWCRRNPGIAGLLSLVLLTLLTGIAVSTTFFLREQQKARENQTLADQKEKARLSLQKALTSLRAQKNETEVQRGWAEHHLKIAEARLYSSQLAKSDREIRDGHLPDAIASLEECQWNLRSIEHDLLWTLGNRDLRTLRGHTSNVNCVAFSSDGKRLASGGLDHHVRVWDMETGEVLIDYPCPRHHGVQSVAFSPDGKRIVWGGGPPFGSSNEMVKVFDATSGKTVHSLNGHKQKVYAVGFSPDGKQILTASGDGTIKIWNAMTGKEIRTLKGHRGKVYCAAFHPDGKRIISGGSDKSIRVWDASTGKTIREMKGHQLDVNCLAISRNGKSLVSGSGDFLNLLRGKIKVWNLDDGKEIQELSGHNRSVLSVAFTPDARRIISGSWDRTIRIWDFTTGKPLDTLQGHTLQVYGVAISPDGERIASGSGDQTVKLWDINQSNGPLVLKPTEAFHRFALSPDGSQLASCGGKLFGRGSVHFWDVATGQLTHRIEDFKGNVASVAYSPDGAYLAAGGFGAKVFGPGAISIWNVKTQKLAFSMTAHKAKVTDVAFSPDGRLLATGSLDKSVKVWDAKNGKELFTLGEHQGFVNCVAFSPTGQGIASGSLDKTIKLWDVSKKKEICTLRGHSDAINSVSFDSTGDRLVSGSADNAIKVWNVGTRSVLTTLRGHSDRVMSTCFSPDDRRILSGGWDRTMKLWDVSTQTEVFSFQKEDGMVMQVGFDANGQFLVASVGASSLRKRTTSSMKIWKAARRQQLFTLHRARSSISSLDVCSDGKRLVSGGFDHTVRVFDLEKGRELFTMAGHSERVNSVAFSSDGKKIASAAKDGKVILWDASSYEAIRSFKQSTPALSVAFDPEGRYLVAGYEGTPEREAIAIVWNLKTGEQIHSLRGHTKSVNCVSFSPNGKLFTGGSDQAIRIWDVHTGKESSVLRGRHQHVNSLAFSRDGKRIISGWSGFDKKAEAHRGEALVFDLETKKMIGAFSDQGQGVSRGSFSQNGERIVTAEGPHVVLWNAITGKRIQTFKGHQSLVNSVLFSPDGKRIISAGTDRTVKVWDVAESDLK